MQSKQEQIDFCRLLVTSTKEQYNNVNKIQCPVLGASVVFNARGFHHLLFKPDGTARDVNERIYKLKLFPLAVPVVKNATGIFEEREVKIRASRKKDTKIKKGETYALVALVGKRNPISVKVIVLRIGDGNFMFWSIMRV